MKKSLFGKTVDITAKDSIHYGGWGFVVLEDKENDEIHVAMYGDYNDCPIFSRKELKARKSK